MDIILVWKLDRFSRSLRNLVNSLAELDTLGVDFVGFRDNLDFSTPSGRLMFQIIGAMAEFERALIQERVRAECATPAPRDEESADHRKLSCRQS